MKLGRLIDELEKCNQDVGIYFDFGGFVPDGIGSYRGYYDQLSIGFCDHNSEKDPKVSDVLKMCKDAVDKTFSGYKGGDFIMGNDTEVWVANYGTCHGTIISGISDKKWRVIIETEFND